MKIKAVIFDLDGTITRQFFNFDNIRAEMGISKDDGPVWEAMMKLSSEQRMLSERILARYERRGVEESSLNDGVSKTLERLKELGIRTGILTRNTAVNAMEVLKKHGLEFDGVIGRDDGPVKPDAFGVLSLCELFEVQPQNTLVVGDYLYDLMCAKNAGAVGVLLKSHRHAENFIDQAEFSIDRIDEVLEIIDDYNLSKEERA